jgi:uncharacterized protein
MGRLLMVLALGLIAAWWIYSRIGKLRDKTPPASEKPQAHMPQDMVVCAHCGLHLPAGEALKDGELHYCGEPHRLLGPRS